jgi:hypothetical protein
MAPTWWVVVAKTGNAVGQLPPPRDEKPKRLTPPENPNRTTNVSIKPDDFKSKRQRAWIVVPLEDRCEEFAVGVR